MVKKLDEECIYFCGLCLLLKLMLFFTLLNGLLWVLQWLSEQLSTFSRWCKWYLLLMGLHIRVTFFTGTYLNGVFYIYIYKIHCSLYCQRVEECGLVKFLNVCVCVVTTVSCLTTMTLYQHKSCFWLNQGLIDDSPCLLCVYFLLHDHKCVDLYYSVIDRFRLSALILWDVLFRV